MNTPAQRVQGPIAALFAVGFAFACVLAWLGWHQTREFQHDMQWTDHTYEVLAALHRIERGLVTAETNQRGYVLTGQRDYLQGLQDGAALALDAIDDLAGLTLDNPDRQALIPQLRSLARSRLELLNQLMVVHDTQGLAAAKAAIAEGSGKRIMDQIVDVTRTTRLRERQLLQQRLAEREENALDLGTLTLLGLLLYLVLLLVTFRLIRRALANQQASKEAAFRARELAEVTLHAIGDGVLITDEQGAVVDMNAEAIKIIGRDLHTLRGKPAREALHLLNRHTREPIKNPAHDALMQRQTVQMEEDAVLVRHDGREVGIEDSAAPIHDAQGQIIGAILVFRDVTERRALADKIASLALYDALTGLANRRLLEDRLQQAIEQAARDNDKVGLLYLDLDRFKHLNDTHGHTAGDALLQAVSARLVQALRGVDTASRIGGDEFVAVLPGIKTADDARRVADKLRAAASAQPAHIDGHDTAMEFSIGVAVYPDDASDPTALMRTADTRMYEDKMRRRGATR